MVSIIGISSFLESSEVSIPLTISSEVVTKVENENFDELIGELDEIEKAVNSTQDPYLQSRKFIESFIREVNARYGSSLSMEDACCLVSQNLHSLNISEEEKAAIGAALRFLKPELEGLEILKSEVAEFQEHNFQSRGWKNIHLYWPWEWNWFGLNKSHHHDSKRQGSFVCRENKTEVELPGNCYFGACEAFAGALLCILPYPVTWGCGIAMITDGGRRVIEGLIQLSDERRLDPNFIPPKPPF